MGTLESVGGWREEYLGGTSTAEAGIIRQLAVRIMEVQANLKASSGAGAIVRAFHAKGVIGATNAQFVVRDDLPDEFRIGFLRPGATYRTSVRFSNASGTVQPDIARDLRGAALRVHVSETEVHDLLMTNGPASHARDPVQFIAFARVLAGSPLLLLPRLVFGIGPLESVRILRNVLSHARTIRSFATERFWSRGPITCGPLAVKYQLRPVDGTAPGPEPDTADSNYLRTEFDARLRAGAVSFDFLFQKYVDARKTPIEDGSVEWLESDTPAIPIARLIIPQLDVNSPEAVAGAIASTDMVDALEFNPWHTTAEFRPLGSLNRARHMVYTASADHRFGYRFYRPTNRVNAVCGWLVRGFFRVLNQFVPWHKLPTPLGSLNLIALRQILRRENIFDTEDYPDLPVTQPVPRLLPGTSGNAASPRPAALGPGPFLPAPPGADATLAPSTEVPTARATDTPYNDLADPRMGGPGARFGRNVPLHRAMPQLERFLDPNPRIVSRVLLTRDYFKPVPTLNVLAAAWIQFMIHGWFDHKLHKPGEKDLSIPLPAGDAWPRNPMVVVGTQESSPASSNPPRPPTFTNTETSWWDASQLYGSHTALTRTLRSFTDGKLTLGTDGLLPIDPDPVLAGKDIDLTGFNNNWWLGLALLHTLFAREHNAICDALKRAYPALNDEQLFQKARLINAALMGKIHTVEWTPCILANPVLQTSMQVVWSGAPRDWLTRLGLWLVEADALPGVLGSLPVHHAARYTNTEEFAAVYKMHPLMPDDFSFYSHEDGRLLGARNLTQVQGEFTRANLTGFAMADLLYSFGVAHPGALTLHNFPRHLQNFTKIDGTVLDLATVDIIRERERGVPRYNDFREILHLPRVKSWNRLTANPRWAAELAEVYGHIDKVDTLVGMFAETPPRGFGFSDTTFHIFVLTATRRIQSDRFFTSDYTPEVYTPLGIRWVETNGMKTVLLRHHPELLPFVRQVENAFGPWNRISQRS
jgi:hypothetical protein